MPLKTVTLKARSQLSFSRKFKNIIWGVVNMLIFPLTLRFHCVRRFILRIFGAQVAPNVRISPYCRIEHPDKLKIGANSSIGHRCYLQGLDWIEIGENVCISDGVSILTGSHDLDSETFDLYTKPVHLEDGVWLAYGSSVLPGVSMGRGAVAGAFSVVRRDVESGQVLAGNPATVVALRVISS